jgi:hypothetical protein
MNELFDRQTCGKLPRYNTTRLCALWIFFGGNLKIEDDVGPIIKCPADPCKTCLHFIFIFLMPKFLGKK